MFAIRRLGPGDEAIVALLAADGSHFELDSAEDSRPPLSADDAADYLADPSVLHWVAEEEGRVLGHLMCLVQRRRSGDPRQVMLYEIGVAAESRRRGIGTALMSELATWCAESGISKVWVLADNPQAEAFYAACGFTPDDPSPVQMSRRLGPGLTDARY